MLPAIELVYSSSTSTNEAAFPAVLSKPLIKMSATQPGSESKVAMQSGQRSGLIRSGCCVYRMKGCGYWEQGFVLFVHETNKDIRAIRGCQMDDEHLRELHFSELIGRKLRELGYHVNDGFQRSVGSEQAFGVLAVFCRPSDVFK